MAGCLDNVDCSDCLERLDLPSRRNSIASVLSGVFFFTGWWIIIGTASGYPSQSEMHHATHVCGVVSTIAFFMVNAVSNAQVTGDSYNTGGCIGVHGARIWLFIGFLLAFSSLIAACWLLFGMYVVPGKSPNWPGIAILLQNLFIFIGNLLFKFGRSEENWQ